jgi:hypothetical protein
MFAIQIVAVDPEGSILAEPENLNKSDTTFYEVEVLLHRESVTKLLKKTTFYEEEVSEFANQYT